MLEPTILFNKSDLMVVKYPHPIKEQLTVWLIRYCPAPPNISEEAATLLLDYLKVSKAYFVYCQNAHKLLNDFYVAIAEKLVQKQEHNRLQRSAVSSLIQELGCITDWVQKYQQIHF